MSMMNFNFVRLVNIVSKSTLYLFSAMSVERISDDPAFNNYSPGWSGPAPPFDARYPHQNQVVNCLRNFLDFYRCKELKGEDYVHCNYFKKVYISKCPKSFREKWEEQMADGVFKYKA
ncbi:Cytochrome c oxidase subunit 6B1 [Mactra antiquata]